jgi:clan AA aspartic protease
MIRGAVNVHREPVVPLRLRGPTGAVTDIEAVVDTGFTGQLTLPVDLVAALGLPEVARKYAILADGSRASFGIHRAGVWWDGGWRSVYVSGFGDGPLIGMELLANHTLLIEVVPGGAVAIDPRP